jgi:hypothetical protein
MRIEINKIGNSDGLIIPRELMQRLDLKRGQFLSIVELAGGGFQAMPYDPDPRSWPRSPSTPAIRRYGRTDSASASG